MQDFYRENTLGQLMVDARKVDDCQGFHGIVVREVLYLDDGVGRQHDDISLTERMVKKIEAIDGLAADDAEKPPLCQSHGLTYPGPLHHNIRLAHKDKVAAHHVLRAGSRANFVFYLLGIQRLNGLHTDNFWQRYD